MTDKSFSFLLNKSFNLPSYFLIEASAVAFSSSMISNDSPGVP
jgi:hypothetical protein